MVCFIDAFLIFQTDTKISLLTIPSFTSIKDFLIFYFSFTFYFFFSKIYFSHSLFTVCNNFSCYRLNLLLLLLFQFRLKWYTERCDTVHMKKPTKMNSILGVCVYSTGMKKNPTRNTPPARENKSARVFTASKLYIYRMCELTYTSIQSSKNRIHCENSAREMLASTR